MDSADLVTQLRRLVGDRHVLVDADMRATYETDWTGAFSGITPCVVRPGSTIEVSQVLELCAALNAPVVPQGGNTGLVGGSVPVDGEVVLSTQRLKSVEEVDTLDPQITVGAGVTLAELQKKVLSSGFDFAVDLAARDSATLGGMVATNAGGMHVVAYGPMRDQLVGIEAVFADGRVVQHLRGLDKDNTGYDLEGLLCGSEGTLAVITRVRVRLVPHESESAVSMVSLATMADAVAVASSLKERVVGLRAIEMLTPSTLALVASHLNARPPMEEAEVVLLVEVAGGEDAAQTLAGQLELQGPLVQDAIVATGPGGQLRIWRFRENATEAIAREGRPCKLDVSVPLQNLADFCSELYDVVASVADDATTYLFGHLGDGNVHVNVVGADDPNSLTRAVLELVESHGGSISAEHGIGRVKRDYLTMNRSADEISVFRTIKDALDPSGIMNPNVLLPKSD
ncbi:MAG: FAD-binding oxidoreductase [Acidimicrobiales bacterium]